MDWEGADKQAYQALFNLDTQVLSQTILEYRCGMTTLNLSLPHVVSIDPLFNSPAESIQKAFPKPHELTKMKAWDLFVKDYPSGLKQGRYVPYTSAALPFTDFQFDLALSVYPFFRMESAIESVLAQLRALVRVAREVRIVPHQLEQEEVTEKLGPTMLTLQQDEVGVEVTPLGEQFSLKNAVMLRLWAHSCVVR